MDNKIVICSVGDLMISDSPLYVSVGVGTAYSESSEKLYRECSKDFKAADIVIGNLESVVNESGRKNLTELQMSTSKQLVNDLHKAGINVLSLANNHCLQHGTACFFNTKNICEDLGITCTGVKDELPVQKKVSGMNLFFLSICLFTEFYQPDDIQYESDIVSIIKKVLEIKSIDKKAIIILSVHWGDEFATYPSNTQVELAHLLADNGVDIILGHHSHVYQGIEKYKESLILYSQGNFVSDMLPDICRETGVAKIIITAEGEKRRIDYQFIPYRINENYIPLKSNAQWFGDRQQELENVLNGHISDEEYMRMVYSNHMKCHNIFRDYFISNFFDYKVNISMGMLYAFLKRKYKKTIGTYPKRYDLDNALLLAKEYVGTSKTNEVE